MNSCKITGSASMVKSKKLQTLLDEMETMTVSRTRVEPTPEQLEIIKKGLALSWTASAIWAFLKKNAGWYLCETATRRMITEFRQKGSLK